MKEVITRGDVAFTDLQLGEGISIAVRAPGLHVAWRSVDATPAAMALAAGATLAAGSEEWGAVNWSAAIAENDLTHFASVEAQPMALEMVRTMTLAMPESQDVFVEMRPRRPAGAGLLAMVVNDGVTQWFLPTNAAQALADAGPFAGPVALGADAEIPAPPPATLPDELHFLIPHSALVSHTSEVQAFAAHASLGSAIVHFFRFDIVGELLGAAVGTVVTWIVNHVDTKREGFRWFDRDAGFPFLTDAERQATSPIRRGRSCSICAVSTARTSSGGTTEPSPARPSTMPEPCSPRFLRTCSRRTSSVIAAAPW
jgi:hypothetical protein